MSWLRMHLKDYKHVIQVFSLVKVTLSMMNPKICYYFSIHHFSMPIGLTNTIAEQGSKWVSNEKIKCPITAN